MNVRQEIISYNLIIIEEHTKVINELNKKIAVLRGNTQPLAALLR